MKTTAQKNKKAMHHILQKELKLAADKKKFDQQFNLNVNKYFANAKEEAQVYEANLNKIKEHRAKELATQEAVGTIEKPLRVGRHKYQMRKTDFQLEDELSGNLRQLKPKGNADLLHERYDDIFRRNLIEPIVPEMSDLKKQKKKAGFKMHNPIGEAVRKSKKRFDKSAKKAADAKKKGVAGDWLKEDLIIV